MTLVASASTSTTGLLIAQLSDPHVCRPGLLYKDVADSNRMFQEALDHLQALDRRPDLLLITGDLVDHGHAEEYAHVRQMLDRLDTPCLLIPGNHDEREPFRQAFADLGYLPRQGPLHYCVDDHAVRILALDCCPPGRHHGELDAESLAWLRDILQRLQPKPTLVLLHHPPMVSGIGYLDEYRYFDADALAAVLSPFSHIEAVLCGHVHRLMARRWAGTMLISCPSTTTEIALQLRASAQPQSFLAPPACLLHLWTPQQGLVSHLSYIGRYPGPYPFF